MSAGQNLGHGHVFPRPDGMKARCGGPGICTECSADLARLQAANKPEPPAPGRTYQFSFGSFTLAEGFPELSPEQVLLVDQTWKERAALLLEEVVREILGPQPGVLGALTPEMMAGFEAAGIKADEKLEADDGD